MKTILQCFLLLKKKKVKFTRHRQDTLIIYDRMRLKSINMQLAQSH